MEKTVVFAGVTNDFATQVLQTLLDASPTPDIQEAKALESIDSIDQWATTISDHIDTENYGPFGDARTLCLAILSLGMRYHAALVEAVAQRRQTRVSGGAA